MSSFCLSALSRRWCSEDIQKNVHIRIKDYNWLRQWNAEGYKGLAPNFGGGRPPKLNKDKKRTAKTKA